MNLEQVKEHFKYAKEVRCLVSGGILDISKLSSTGFYITELNDIQVQNSKGNIIRAYRTNTNQLAEILTYIFERDEEVEVSDDLNKWGMYYNVKFLTFSSKGKVVVEHINGSIGSYKYIRKLQPQSLLEPELTALKDKAKEKGVNVTVIFENNN